MNQSPCNTISEHKCKRGLLLHDNQVPHSEKPLPQVSCHVHDLCTPRHCKLRGLVRMSFDDNRIVSAVQLAAFRCLDIVSSHLGLTKTYLRAHAWCIVWCCSLVACKPDLRSVHADDVHMPQFCRMCFCRSSTGHLLTALMQHWSGQTSWCLRRPACRLMSRSTSVLERFLNVSEVPALGRPVNKTNSHEHSATMPLISPPEVKHLQVPWERC